MSLDDKNKKSSDSEPAAEKAVVADNRKKYVALKTIKVICNGEFSLEEGKEIPAGIDKAFVNSLINSNLIK